MALSWSKLPSHFTRVGFILICVILFCSASAGAGEILDVNSGDFSTGGRNLLQVTYPCPHQFQYDNFTNLILACPTPNATNDSNYPKKSCCAALADLLCPWEFYLNQQSSDCAKNFWSTLPLATNYSLTQEDFQGICTDPNNPNGIPCPSAPAPAPNHSAPRLVWELLPFAVLMMAMSTLFPWF